MATLQRKVVGRQSSGHHLQANGAGIAGIAARGRDCTRRGIVCKPACGGSAAIPAQCSPNSLPLGQLPPATAPRAAEVEVAPLRRPLGKERHSAGKEKAPRRTAIPTFQNPLDFGMPRALREVERGGEVKTVACFHVSPVIDEKLDYLRLSTERGNVKRRSACAVRGVQVDAVMEQCLHDGFAAVVHGEVQWRILEDVAGIGVLTITKQLFHHLSVVAMYSAV
mmetsp:Transcript_28198/g.61556  ORF Transcript_28198/g.61556 Transcript_28198/m.61556 type:complete len:223 (+) Transcript_28198:402-1070(+)